MIEAAADATLKMLVDDWIDFWGTERSTGSLSHALRAFQIRVEAKPELIISAVARSGTHSILELHAAGRSIWPLMYAIRDLKDWLH